MFLLHSRRLTSICRAPLMALMTFVLGASAIVNLAHAQAPAAAGPAAAAARPAPTLAPLGGTAPATGAEYKVGPGDVVRVLVFQNPDLTTEARVTELSLIHI